MINFWSSFMLFGKSHFSMWMCSLWEPWTRDLRPNPLVDYMPPPFSFSILISIETRPIFELSKFFNISLFLLDTFLYFSLCTSFRSLTQLWSRTTLHFQCINSLKTPMKLTASTTRLCMTYASEPSNWAILHTGTWTTWCPRQWVVWPHACGSQDR